MQQRGKRSAMGLATVTAMPSRLVEPPTSLTEAQAGIWCAVVATKPADWFDAGSIPLLIAYCKATTEHARVSAQLDTFDDEWLKEDEALARFGRLVSIQDRLAGRMTSLATKMRLSQQSRYATRGADRESRKAGGARPWNRVIED